MPFPMYSNRLVSCSHSTKRNTVLASDAPNSSSGSGNSEENAQINADAPVFLRALSPAGSHQAEMMDYKSFGLFGQVAEPRRPRAQERCLAASPLSPALRAHETLPVSPVEGVNGKTLKTPCQLRPASYAATDRRAAPCVYQAQGLHWWLFTASTWGPGSGSSRR